jgi:hypothetical protein
MPPPPPPAPVVHDNPFHTGMRAAAEGQTGAPRAPDASTSGSNFAKLKSGSATEPTTAEEAGKGPDSAPASAGGDDDGIPPLDYDAVRGLILFPLLPPTHPHP